MTTLIHSNLTANQRRRLLKGAGVRIAHTSILASEGVGTPLYLTQPQLNDFAYAHHHGLNASLRFNAQQVQHHGAGLWSNLKYRFSIGNTNRVSPSVERLLDKYGNEEIASVAVNKQPVASAATKILSVLTLGKFDRKRKELGYDAIVHTALVVTLRSGRRIVVQKNATLEVEDVSTRPKQFASGNVPITVKPGLTMRSFIENAAKKDPKTVFKYAARSDNGGANCQATARALIRDSEQYFEHDAKTEKALQEQDGKALLSTLPKSLQGVPDKITDLGAIVSRIQGKGLRVGAARRLDLASFI